MKGQIANETRLKVKYYLLSDALCDRYVIQAWYGVLIIFLWEMYLQKYPQKDGCNYILIIKTPPAILYKSASELASPEAW